MTFTNCYTIYTTVGEKKVRGFVKLLDALLPSVQKHSIPLLVGPKAPETVLTVYLSTTITVGYGSPCSGGNVSDAGVWYVI